MALEPKLDPIQRVVYVYQPGQKIERLEAPREVAEESVLPGFVLSMDAIWPS